MRLLLAVLLAMTCERERKLDVDSASTITETERNASAGTEKKVETRTREPSEIVTQEGTKKFAWVQPPEGSDAGVQWLPVEEKTTSKTAKIGATKAQRQFDTAWNASGEGTRGAEEALKVKSSDVGSSSAGPTKTFWMWLGVGAAVALVAGVVLFAWLKGKKP